MLDKLRDLHDRGLTGETIRYLVGTGISASLSLLLPLLFHEILGISEEIAVALSLMIVFFVNFFVVRKYVFRSSAPALRQMFKFALSSAAFRMGEYMLFFALYTLAGAHYMAALLVALTVSFFGKFVFYRMYVFARG